MGGPASATGPLSPLAVLALLAAACVLAARAQSHCVECHPLTQYLGRPCTAAQANTCLNLTVCAGEEVQVVTPTLTSDRECGTVPAAEVECVLALHHQPATVLSRQTITWANRTVPIWIGGNLVLMPGTKASCTAVLQAPQPTWTESMMPIQQACLTLLGQNDWDDVHWILVAFGEPSSVEVIPQSNFSYPRTDSLPAGDITWMKRCQATDPCCHTSVMLSGPLDSPAVQRCLEAITIGGRVRMSTLRSLAATASWYAFGDIAADSTRSVASLADGLDECGFAVYNISFDLSAWVAAQIADLVAEADVDDDGVATDAELQQVESNAADFYAGLTTATARLHDAHTGYDSPLGGVLLWGVTLTATEAFIDMDDSDGVMDDQQLVVQFNCSEMPSLPCNGTVEVVDVDGMPFMSWLAGRVGWRAGVKSASAAFNSCLSGVQSIFFSDLQPDWRTMPDVASVRLQSGELASIKVSNMLLLQLQNLPDTTLAGIQRLLAGRLEASFVTPADPRRTLPSTSNPPDRPRRGGLPVTGAEGDGEAAAAGLSAIAGSLAPDMLQAFALTGSNTTQGDGAAVVVKITQFNTALVYEKDVLPAILAVTEYARQHNITRLIIDVIGNGGGDVNLGYRLLHLLRGEVWDDPGLLCEPYTQRLSDPVRRFLQTVGQGSGAAGLMPHFNVNLSDPEALAAVADAVAEQACIWGSELCGLDVCHVDICEEARNDAKTLRAFNNQARGRLTSVELRKAIQTMTFSGGLGSILGFDGRTIFDSASGKRQVAGEREEQWGPRKTWYTSLHRLACAPEPLSDVDLSVSRQFTEQAVLTDGTCGSTCSMFATKLMLSGNVTVFGFGGVPREAGNESAPLDITSFNGGAVSNWDPEDRNDPGFFAAVVESTIAYNLLAMYTSVDPVDVADLAGRYPVHGENTRFTFNMGFFDEMGPDALPREWYRMPPHKHFRFWATGLESAEANPAALARLYAKVSAEDWAQVRQQPQFFPAECTAPAVSDKGWSTTTTSSTLPPSTTTTAAAATTSHAVATSAGPTTSEAAPGTGPSTAAPSPLPQRAVAGRGAEVAAWVLGGIVAVMLLVGAVHVVRGRRGSRARKSTDNWEEKSQPLLPQTTDTSFDIEL